MDREVDVYSLGHLDRWKVLCSTKMSHPRKDVVALALLSEIPNKCCPLLHPSYFSQPRVRQRKTSLLEACEGLIVCLEASYEPGVPYEPDKAVITGGWFQGSLSVLFLGEFLRLP